MTHACVCDMIHSYVCGMTHSYDSFICVTIWFMSVCHISYHMCMTWLILVCVWHHLFLCVCDMTRSYVYDMTHSCVCDKTHSEWDRETKRRRDGEAERPINKYRDTGTDREIERENTHTHIFWWIVPHYPQHLSGFCHTHMNISCHTHMNEACQRVSWYETHMNIHILVRNTKHIWTYTYSHEIHMSWSKASLKYAQLGSKGVGSG